MAFASKRSYRYRSKWESWRQAKARIEAQLKKSPRLYSLVRWIWTTSRWFMLSCRRHIAPWFLRNLRDVFDADKTLWVSPERIVYCSLCEFDIYEFKGAVIGGDWDRLEKKFNELDVYVAFREVFMEGKDWQETAFYQHVVDAVNRGEFIWGCANQNDIRRRCKDLETLFLAIKTKGYKSQHELLRAGRLLDRRKTDDEVTISIGREGDLLFGNGAHRLTIAKLIGIKSIPVKIAVRHPLWIAFIDDLLQYSTRLGGRLYQPAMHPDLKDIPAFHQCEDRFTTVKEKMSAKGGRLLDIGANLGYFCHRFEDEGFECCAVEDSKQELYFLKRLRRAENRNFKIVGKSIFEWLQVEDMRFDVVLALNVFHHALKTKKSYNDLLTLLHRLKMGELFFEPPNEDDAQMKDAYRNYTPSEFVQFVMQNTKFTKVELIGKADDQRMIYRLS